MALISYTPNRVIDSDGISDGASLYVYQSGTTTKVDLFSDSGYTSPLTNPYVVPAGAGVPSFYTDYTGDVRVQVVSASGEIPYDEDPYMFRVTMGDIRSSNNNINVLDYMPPAVKTAVMDRSITTSVISYIEEAATVAIGLGHALYFPAGTYPFLTWTPPASLMVKTDGPETMFKQMDTGGVATRLIVITNDNVSLWPGGSATIDGSIDTIPTNATEQNHGVAIIAYAGTVVNKFTMGDVYGQNIGGDVFLSFVPEGYIGHCKLGTIYGRNIYRAIVAITGGLSGEIDAIIQEPGAGVGAGLGALFFEPDAACAVPPDQWNIGMVRGRSISIVGDPAHTVDKLRIGSVHLDYDAYGVSTPAYNTGGINVTSAPDQFLNGIRYRNVRDLHIGSLYVKGHPKYAFYDLGENAGDDISDSVRIDHFKIVNVATSATSVPLAEIVLQKHRKVVIKSLVSVDKAALSMPTFYVGSGCEAIEVSGGEVEGRFILGGNDLTLNNVKLTSLAGENIFRYVLGRIRIVAGSGSGNPAVMFEGCDISPSIEDWTGGTIPISGTTPSVHLARCNINGAYYELGWSNASSELANAVDDAAAATAGVPLGGVYRNGSVLMVRIA